MKFPNGEILSAAKAGMTLELDYHGQLFRPLLTEASFESYTITVQRIQDTMEKVWEPIKISVSARSVYLKAFLHFEVR